MAGLILQGDVLSVAHVHGQNVNERTGEVRHYDYHRVRVLIEDEVLDVKLDNLGGGAAEKYEGPVPNKGDTVTYDVSLSAYKDQTSGRAQIAVRALRPSRPAAVAPHSVKAG